MKANYANEYCMILSKRLVFKNMSRIIFVFEQKVSCYGLKYCNALFLGRNSVRESVEGTIDRLKHDTLLERTCEKIVEQNSTINKYGFKRVLFLTVTKRYQSGSIYCSMTKLELKRCGI